MTAFTQMAALKVNKFYQTLLAVRLQYPVAALIVNFGPMCIYFSHFYSKEAAKF